MQMSQAALERSARTTVTVKYVDIQMKYFNLFFSRGSISKPVKITEKKRIIHFFRKILLLLLHLPVCFTALYIYIYSFFLNFTSRVVSVLDSGVEGRGFKSQSRRCQVTVLGKLFTPIMPLFTKQQNW